MNDYLFARANPNCTWVLYMTYRGHNAANKSGVSSKFWELRHRAGNPNVIALWGKIGTSGQTKLYTLEEGLEKAREKREKGGYVESGQQTLNHLTGILRSKGAPYNQITQVGTDSTGYYPCRDSLGDVVMTLTYQGVVQLLSSGA